MTRKAPTGPKHDRCIGHVEHPYPAKGMLCYSAISGEAGMVAFADHLATVRAEHRAAFLAETPAQPDSWYVGSGKARKLRRIGEFRGHDVVPSVCDGTRCHGSSVHAHGQGASVRQLRDDTGLSELVARFAEMRGRPAIDAASVVLAEREMAPVRKPRAVKVAPVVAEPIAETPAPITPSRFHFTYEGPAAGSTYCAEGRIAGDVYQHVAIDATVRASQRARADLCDRCAETFDAIEAPAPDTYAAAIEIAETRPDPCEECGHPAHGATCATCDDAAQVGQYAPCAVVAPVQAPAEPIAEPAPVLSAPASVMRPTCERCGQSFRKSGSGAEWHRLNRPDCARVAVAS